MAEPTDLRTLAAEAIHAVDCACPTPDRHTPDVFGHYDELVDAVLAAVLPAAVRAIEALADRRHQDLVLDTPADTAAYWAYRAAITDAANVVRRLATTGPGDRHQTPQTPERAEVVVPEAPGAQRPSEGFTRFYSTEEMIAALDKVPPRPAAAADEPPLDSIVHLASYYGVYERVERGWIDANSPAGGRGLGWQTLVRLNSGAAPVLLVPAADLAKVTAERDRLAETIRRWQPVIDAARDYIAGCKDPGSPAQVIGFVNLRNAIDALDDTDQAAGAEPGELRWHYGPTDTDPDPGKRWHHDCGGEIYGFKEGDICAKCGAQDEPADDAQRRDDQGE